MIIRHSTENDFSRIMEIYKEAREFMAATGNPNQWGPTNWPPEELIHEDIKRGCSYVCVKDDNIVATFYHDYGHKIDSTYDVIEDGQWIGSDNYGVVHRIAADKSVKGAGTFCLNWAAKQCGDLRIDTHPDNKVMQNLLTKLGFEKCGIIHVVEDNFPRFAYEKVDREHEYLDIVDENGQPTGKVVERSKAHAEGIRHRTSHVWILRKKERR